MKKELPNPLVALFAVAPTLRGATNRVLSVYIPARAGGYNPRYYDIVFGDLRHRYRERLGERDLEVLDRELPRIRAQMALARPSGGATFACFAESSTGLLEIIELPALAEERLEVGAPLLAPALRQMEQLPAAVVAVA